MKANEFRGSMIDINSIADYVKGGRGMFTMESTQSGKHLTYRITCPKTTEAGKEKPLWVSVLCGDNKFQFLGTLWLSKLIFYRSPKAKASENSDSIKGISWLINHIRSHKNLPSGMNFWHEGVCCRCGRALTRPESIVNGIGPVCSNL